jgi:hypothetical protein
VESVPAGGEYPQPAVAPELFPASAACNTALPVGEVIEWFDFGQFVELFATDTSGVSHALVLTEEDHIVQEMLRVSEKNGGQPTRAVDVAEGVPINRAVAGDGFDAFKTLVAPETVVVDDVDDLIARGSLKSGDSTYEMTLRRPQIEALRDGEPVVLRVRAESSGKKRRTWIQLTPKVIPVKVSEAELDQLLADSRVTVNDETITLKLEPIEVAALLAARTVVVRGISGSKTRLVRLRQREDVEVGFATHPAASDYAIKDLVAFLTNPVVPGLDKLPFKVTLTADVVKSLREGASTPVDLGGGQVLTLRVEQRAT